LYAAMPPETQSATRFPACRAEEASEIVTTLDDICIGAVNVASPGWSAQSHRQLNPRCSL